MLKIKKSKPLKKLIIAIVLCCTVFVGCYFLLAFLSSNKIIYESLLKNYSDSHCTSFIESDSNLNNVKSLGSDFAETLLCYQIVSEATNKKIEYLSPFLLYAKTGTKELNKAKQLNNNQTTAKNRFADAIKELDNKIQGYKAEQSNQVRFNDVKTFYYQVYLPRYQSFIESKQALSQYIEHILTSQNFINEPTQNIVNLQNLYIDFAMTFVLPSIAIRETVNTEFENFITDENIISLKYVNIQFDIVIQNSNYNFEYAESFLNAYSTSKMALQTANNIFSDLTKSQKDAYLASDKTKPLTLPSATTSTFGYVFMQSILAKTDGTLVCILNDGRIKTYFEGGQND